MDDVQTSKGAENTIELPEPSYECSQESTSAETSDCSSTNYASLIYITGQRCFWLLSDDALNAIQKSSASLLQIVKTEEVSERIEGLKAIGISDLFVPAHPRTFLPRMLQDEWKAAERDRERLESEAAALVDSFKELDDEYARLYHEVRNSPDASKATKQRYNDIANTHYSAKRDVPKKHRELRASIHKCTKRIQELQDMGFSAAESAGFVVQDNTLYSPHQQKVFQLLREYKKAKTDFLNHELPDEAKYHTFMRLCRGHGRSVECQLSPTKENLVEIEEFLEEYYGHFSHIGPYLEKAIELASNGVAVAEYVLANHDDIRTGLDKLSEYHQMERDYRKVESDLENAVVDWAKVLGRNGPIPSVEIEQYRKKLEAHSARMYRFQKETEALSRKMEPVRLFVWNPDDFAAEPFKVLMKPGMPLREYTQIGNDKVLNHFCLNDLPGIVRHVDGVHPLPENDVYSQETAEHIALSLKKAQKSEHDEILERVLTGLGCQKLDMDPAWFSDRGLFHPDLFYTQVQARYSVSALKSEEDKEKWGINLRSVLFEKDARKHLMVFDDSYMAQFSRYVLGGIDRDVADYVRTNVKISAQSSFSGPDSGVEGSTKIRENGEQGDGMKVKYGLANASVGGRLTVMQGHLDLFDIRLPEPQNARPFKVRYQTKNGLGEMHVGRFYCELNAKLTGYVGANVMLTGGLGIEVENGKGLTLSGINNGMPEGQMDAFAGAQVSVVASTSLYWNLPDEVRKKVNYMRAHDPVEEWACVGMLSAGLTASWGVGYSRSFQLGMKNGKLVFVGDAGMTTGLGLKGKLAFEIDFKTVSYWMAVVQNELHKNDYRHIEWVTPDAFDFLSMLSYLSLTTALDASFFAARQLTFVQKVFDSINQSERAGMVALRIDRAMEEAAKDQNGKTAVSYQEWFRGLQPEAIGPLLHNLVSEPVPYEGEDGSEPKSEEEMLRLQQSTILQCLRWMNEAEDLLTESYRGAEPNRVQRQFEESVIRMNTHGKKPEGDLILVARNNVARLDEFMGRGLKFREDEIRYEEYQRVRSKLDVHIWKGV
ncbi:MULTISPECIES: hypothetical protein [Marinobacter]|uniref:Uncharacterized protein n=1 Tax=Marinobacter excellens LAMA 842 TaxID=1306954 RepID=A0A137S3N4_9GAMM|nr:MULTISPECIES: hypothetical protein [Marinobacter]KXO07034.1 hypothetical protein J122_3528 [Marinobacter excellens LAMA 842]MCD1629633.1 hypothetical protein [Marinobacter shengliensis]